MLERSVLAYEDGIESVRCERDELYSSWDTRVFCTHGAGWPSTGSEAECSIAKWDSDGDMEFV